MSTESYTIKSGDKFNVFTGAPLSSNTPAGTIIYGDRSTGQSYGTSPNSSEPTTSYYGQNRNQNTEQQALEEEQGIAGVAGNQGIINSSFLSKLTSDPAQVAFYVNALAYGGYTIGDVLNDMKRKELSSQGNTQAGNLKIIDPEQNRSAYLSTAEGQNSVTTSSSLIPTFNLGGLVNPDILKYGTNIPDQLFQTLVPGLDPNSQEFKDQVSQIQGTFYDLTNAQLQAKTEQDKAVADTNLQNFKNFMDQQYGIVLSDDALKAWGQINTLETSLADRNLGGSGMEQENIEDSLRDTRRQDQKYRTIKLTREESEKAATALSSYSPAQIAALTPEQRQAWGLTPSPQALQSINTAYLANLRQRNPNEANKTDAELLQEYPNPVIDENGNYRSGIYSKYYSDVANNKVSANASANAQVMQENLNKENTAYANYDNSQPFSKATPANNTQMNSDASKVPSSAPPGSSSSNPVSNTVEYNTVTGAKLTPGQTFVDASGKTVKEGDPANPSTPVPAKVNAPVVTTPKYPSVTSTITSTQTPKTSTPLNINNGAIVAPEGIPKSPSVNIPSPYKIVGGDTLDSIAAKNKTTVANLTKINNIQDPNKIYAGQTLKLS